MPSGGGEQLCDGAAVIVYATCADVPPSVVTDTFPGVAVEDTEMVVGHGVAEPVSVAGLGVMPVPVKVAVPADKLEPANCMVLLIAPWPKTLGEMELNTGAGGATVMASTHAAVVTPPGLVRVSSV